MTSDKADLIRWHDR